MVGIAGRCRFGFIPDIECKLGFIPNTKCKLFYYGDLSIYSASMEIYRWTLSASVRYNHRFKILLIDGGCSHVSFTKEKLDCDIEFYLNA
jgi:hypothetical protein